MNKGNYSSYARNCAIESKKKMQVTLGAEIIHIVFPHHSLKPARMEYPPIWQLGEDILKCIHKIIKGQLFQMFLESFLSKPHKTWQLCWVLSFNISLFNQGDISSNLVTWEEIFPDTSLTNDWGSNSKDRSYGNSKWAVGWQQFCIKFIWKSDQINVLILYSLA